MPTFLSDPTRAVYLLLIAAAVVTGAVAAKNQTRRGLVPFAVALALLLLVALIDRVVETPREEATRRVQAMADAATAADPARFAEHVSPSFAMNGKGRDDLKASPLWGQIRNLQARVAVWGFGHDAYERLSDTEVEVGFYVKGQATAGMVMYYAKARFVRDPDGAYRAKSIRFFNPAEGGLNQEVSVPNFP